MQQPGNTAKVVDRPIGDWEDRCGCVLRKTLQKQRMCTPKDADRERRLSGSTFQKRAAISVEHRRRAHSVAVNNPHSPKSRLPTFPPST